MKIFRRLSTPRLLSLLAVFAATGLVVSFVAVAAFGGSGAPPAPEPLAQAVHDALTASPPAGITGDVTFTNNLLPSGSLLGNVSSALLSGASGRVWLTNDGRGRIELQSDAGDAQLVWSPSQLTVYDASSNTAYELALPSSSTPDTSSSSPAPTLDEIAGWLLKLEQHANVSDVQPGVVANEPAYSVSVSPTENGGLIGDAQLAWDATNGVPLRIAITAKGDPTPVLELKVTDISFGPVASSDVDLTPPAGAKVVDLGTAPNASSGSQPGQPTVTGLDAVRAAVPFALAAPASVNGQALSSARLVGKGALLTYGDGLGALVVHESASDGANGSSSLLGSLPKVTLGSTSAYELQTPLGTVLTFEHDGVSFLLGGSMTSGDAEAAAKSFA